MIGEYTCGIPIKRGKAISFGTARKFNEFEKVSDIPPPGKYNIPLPPPAAGLIKFDVPKNIVFVF